jgi:hypothetical protein
VAVVQYKFTQNNTQNNTIKQNTQNGTYIKIRIRNLQNCFGIQIIEERRLAVPILNGPKHLRKYSEYTGSRNAM